MMAGDALAKTGATSAPTKAGAKEDADDIEQGTADDEDDNIDRQSGSIPNLEVMDWDINSSGTVDVRFLGQFPLGHEYILCWAVADDVSWPCWWNGNEIAVTDSNGIGDWGVAIAPSEDFSPYLNIWDWEVDINSNSSDFDGFGGDLDPIECGVEYRFKLASNTLFNDFYTEELLTFSCDGPDEVEEECTECPYGGAYDGANCYLGGAPEGAQAFMNNGYYGYTPTDGDCDLGDILLRNGCGVMEIPPEVDPFVWQNGYYYHPICE